MITMQEMEKELAIYRKNFTAVRLISEADILRTIEARKHNPASRACPCRDGRMTSQGCRNCIVLRAYMEKCKKIKLEYDDPNVYQVTRVTCMSRAGVMCWNWCRNLTTT